MVALSWRTSSFETFHGGVLVLFQVLDQFSEGQCLFYVETMFTFQSHRFSNTMLNHRSGCLKGIKFQLRQHWNAYIQSRLLYQGTSGLFEVHLSKLGSHAFKWIEEHPVVHRAALLGSNLNGGSISSVRMWEVGMIDCKRTSISWTNRCEKNNVSFSQRVEFLVKFILFYKDLLATKTAIRNCHLGRQTGLCLPLQTQNKS